MSCHQDETKKYPAVRLEKYKEAGGNCNEVLYRRLPKTAVCEK